MPLRKKRKLQQKPQNILKKDPFNFPIAFKLRDALVKQGYKGLQLELLLTQAAYESGRFYKDAAIKENNLAGVQWFSSMKDMPDIGPSKTFIAHNGIYNKEGVRIGTKLNPYARFDNMDAFAAVWPKTAHLTNLAKGSKNTIGPPLEANDLIDYNHRLFLQTYYYKPTTEKQYLSNLISLDAEVRKLLLHEQPIPEVEVNTLFDSKGNLIPGKRMPIGAPEPKAVTHKLFVNTRQPGHLKEHLKTLFGMNSVSEVDKLKALIDSSKRKSVQPALPQHKKTSMSRLFHGAGTSAFTVNNRHSNVGYSFSGIGSPPGKPPIAVKRKNTHEIHGKTKPVAFIINERNTGNNLSYGNTSSGSGKTYMHVNTPLIGQLTIHTSSTNDGMNNLKNKIEEVLLQVLNGTGAIA